MSVIELHVVTPLKELDFRMPTKKTARDLFLEICRNLGIRETWYFGINYPHKEQTIWIDASQKKLSAYRTEAKNLKFAIKYYPENVESDLIENITIKHFFEQVRREIVKDKMYCPPETCVLLASYAVQAKYGEFDGELNLAAESLLPERVFKQHKTEKSTFLKSIASMWKKHRGLSKEDAMFEYLKLSQNLEMFGVHYFPITNAKKVQVFLGITPLGLNIYKLEDKLNAIILFPWSEIGKLDFRGKKFIIKTVDKGASDFVFFSDDEKNNKRILNLGIGYHLLYTSRRKPETFEILQMRENAAAQKEILDQHKNKLRREIEARNLLEARYKQEIDNLRDEITLSQKQLQDSQNTIDRLNKQLLEIEQAKREYEKRQKELEDMLRQLEESKDFEASERQKLEEEIAAKQAEMRRIQDEVDLKNEETRRLQEEVEAARLQHEELLRAQQEENARREAEQAELERMALAVKSEIPESIEVSEQLKEEVKELQNALLEVRDETEMTTEDKIHLENLKDGRTKYKTLMEIRKGNTNRRIDLFESVVG